MPPLKPLLRKNQNQRTNTSTILPVRIWIPLFLVALFCLTKTYAQQKNFSYFKLAVTNEKEEMLLVKYKGIWELPGKKYVDPRTISEFAGFMAEELGVVQEDLRLRGLFTFYYNEAVHPILFNYYSSKYKSGTIKAPSDCTNIAWFSIDEALKIIPFKTMRLVLEKMYEEKGYVWGASMRIYKDTPHVIREVIMEEDFYPLSK